MADKENLVTIEEGKRFSQCYLWQMQLDYFIAAGPKAWAGTVPFYITSNPSIGHCYAEVVMAYILDRVQSKNYDPEQPFYLLELGTGSGKFSYYTMKRVFEVQKELKLTEVKIVYVMSDFTASNLEFWRAQPQLEEYLQAGQLDFAIFNVFEDKEITLSESKTVLSAGKVNNPMMAFANYVFDTIPNDIFKVKDKKLQEAKVHLALDKKHLDETNKVKSGVDIGEVDVTLNFSDAKADIYADPLIDPILTEYANNLGDTHITFPTAGFTLIKTLMSISNNQLLLISTDKGYNFLSEIENRGEPRVVSHGSFSMMVNYHALARFVENNGGECWHQKIREGIKTTVFLVGDHFKDLTFTYKAIKDNVDDFGPGDFFNYHRHLRTTRDECELKTIVSHMNFSHWDPRIFDLFVHKMVKELRKAPSNLVDALKEGVDLIIDNIYEMPGMHETYFNIAWFLHVLNRSKEAISYYEKFIGMHKKDFTVMYNMALCYAAVEDDPKALECFKEALKFDSSSKDAKEWISWLEEKIDK
ncbi:MAG: tetratricopeptide repeat protein [Gammaproteobacteria bacterium]